MLRKQKRKLKITFYRCYKINIKNMTVFKYFVNFIDVTKIQILILLRPPDPG